MEEIKLLSLFSGIGAFEKSLERLGITYKLVNYCEIDKYASKAYSMIHKCNEALNLGDITQIDTSKLPNDIEIVTYGFPCQDISLAGKQRGFEAEGERTRSGLFFEALRIIEDKKPKVAVCENVKNLTSKKFKKEFNIVLASLEKAGYNNYWQVLNAKDYGIPQNRERVFIVSIRKDIDNGMFKFPVPFELELRLKDMLEDEVNEKYYLKDIKNFYIKNSFLMEAKGNGFRFEPHVKENAELSKCITTKSGNRMDDNYIIEGVETKKSKFKFDSTNAILVKEATKKGYAEAYEGDSVNLEHPNSKTRRGRVGKQVAQTLTTSCNQAVIVSYIEEYIKYLRIRKLTPLECFRLMGFDDEDFNKIKGISNTQLYKMAGNSIVVDVLANLFSEVFKAVKFETTDNKPTYEQMVLEDYLYMDKDEEVNGNEPVAYVAIKEATVSDKNIVTWEELDTLVGKPLYDGDLKQWRILSEYRRDIEGYYVGFTDTSSLKELDINNIHLYKNEIA